MKKILFTIFLLHLSTSFFPNEVFAALKQSGAKTEVRGRIPEKTYVRIFGYTSPNSIVQVTGIRVFAQAISQLEGYFVIYDVPISREAKEICVHTIDVERRIGFPLCIGLPDLDKPTEIGPLLLAPTLSLSSGAFWQNDRAYATGRTIPNQEVIVSFFEVPPDSIPSLLAVKIDRLLFPKAIAVDLPLLSARSDSRGNFSFNVPTAYSTGYRLFAKAFSLSRPTFKSQNRGLRYSTSRKRDSRHLKST